jgi:ketosteroid isomerase-like protein
MTAPTLEDAFGQWRSALNSGDLDAFYALMDDAMVIFDEDIPWRFSKADFVDHIAFHVPLWESFQWVPRELRFQAHGTTGVISGYATFRGKPRDAGFRQRFMGFTQTWVNDARGWRLVCWHQGPLHGQIDGASPS